MFKSSPKSVFQRVLLKLSGEALLGDDGCIDADSVTKICDNVASMRQSGVQVAIVIGGGNIVRGRALTKMGIDQVAADHMGILATVINGLALKEAFNRADIPTKVMSTLAIPSLVCGYNRDAAVADLEAGNVVVFVAGTGNPLFTTDTTASLRAIEIKADILLKATKVKGVYSEDPVKNPNAELFSTLSFDDVLSKNLGVMDLSAICLCRDHDLPIRVFDMNAENILKEIVSGQALGTLVTKEV